MKALYATLVCTQLCIWVSGNDLLASFQEWKVEHDKEYRTTEEEFQKFLTFRDNAGVVDMLNDKFSPKTEFLLNHFADMTTEDFKNTVLMSKREAPDHPREKYMEHPNMADPLPETFDWTGKGVVTPVKDQGSAGTCWAFSTVQNLEGQWAMAGHKLTNLSVEQVVDCDGTEDVPGNKADCGVFGGWPFLAFQYVMRAGGMETAEDYSYCAGGGGKPGTCFVCPAPGFNKTLCGPPIPYCMMNESCFAKLDKSKFLPGFKVADWKAIDKNETVMAYQMMKLGPLSIALDAQLLQFYHSGVFDPPAFLCNPKSLDHAVLLVGWGVDKGLIETTPYWKVKNSWGPKWGEQGYFRIKRGDGKCGMNTAVATGILAN